ncbi:MAG: efflux RND transporter periplasmic adaptor subunit, partial [Hyphomonas sp.]|nr:efflux RND transporter periplasmic adaptor subunit [Hyphomonas sp.]
GETLRARFAQTRLEPILEEAEAALRAAKTADDGSALADNLARLTTAIEPWLLDGAPVHYREAGLILFRDTGTGRLWLQEGADPHNPYTDGPSEPVAWPDPMKGVRP